MPFSGDVVSRCRDRASADEGQAKRPVDALSKATAFSGGETLIVIHRHDDVEIPFQRVVKHRVPLTGRRHRSHAFCIALNRRCNGRDFFITNSPPSPRADSNRRPAIFARDQTRSRQDLRGQFDGDVIFPP